jgi:YidC/Oxa1 family membrane protein insertase
MAIDFGWFFMLTKPLLHLLDIMARIFNNMGVVILLITLMFKVITYPLMSKSLHSAAKMREVQPKIAALQKAYAHDKQRMNQELMALYKKEQISPLSGCFPMLLQAPIFFCLYKVFFISIEMRHAPLFGWIHDLAAPDQCYLFNLFGIIDWAPPKFLQIGVWPLIMGFSMFLQQKLSSAKNSNSGSPKTQEAKIQENMMYALPVIFTYVCSSFPVGVVIYWTISNVFSIIQQYYLNNKIKKRQQ